MTFKASFVYVTSYLQCVSFWRKMVVVCTVKALVKVIFLSYELYVVITAFLLCRATWIVWRK